MNTIEYFKFKNSYLADRAANFYTKETGKYHSTIHNVDGTWSVTLKYN